MKKIIVTLFLIMLGGIAVFAQRGDGDYRKGKGENSTVDIERQCYNSTNSFAEFKRCVERQRLPICPRGWETKASGGNYRDFPCRDERNEDHREERRFDPIDREDLRDYRNKDWKEKI